MNNYQLYRTNVLLGGQMKWDLIINSSQNTLYVSDFHLSPISNNIPYTYKSNEYLIKNKHQDNVKAYYAANKGHFYSEGLDSEFLHNWPVICKEDTCIDAYSNTYDMGCRRSKRYNEYKKQFEFFCPLWLEHINGDITFILKLKDVDSDTVLASSALKLAMNDINNTYHNNFVKYFNNYIKDAGLQSGNDDVLNVVISSNTAKIMGLNVATGVFETQTISDLIDNITNREKPLMEIDNILIQSFANSNIVCNQLFNFNLCFDIDDIISGSITNMLSGEDVIISIDAYVGDTLLETYDFYTEYDYINKAVQANNVDTNTINYNVLDYLHDNENVDLINKNKFCQSTCHWALCDNPDYIFNLYEGYSGLFATTNTNGEVEIYENEHQYCNAPNTFILKADKNQNSTGWISHLEITKWSQFYKYINNTNKYKKEGTFLRDNYFINNVKYNYVPNLNEGNGIYLISLSMPGSLLSSIISSFDCVSLDGNFVYIMRKDDLVLILSRDVNKLSFNGFYNILYTLHASNFDSIENESIKLIVSELYLMMANKIDPTVVIFDKSISYIALNNPSNDALEVTYYKDDNAYNYVIRYDGKLKPAFTKECSTLYYKDYLNEEKLKTSVYTKFDANKFEPLYPSINYCAIKKIKNWQYDKLPKINVAEHTSPVDIYSNTFEYSWFNTNKCIILSPKIEFTFVNKKIDNNYQTVDTIITNYLKSYYNTDDEQLVLYIKNLYEYTNNWDYFSDTNIDDYTYNISMKLR